MRRPDLVADCSQCAALCCVALPFDRSEDFAINKGAGARCPNLQPDCRCSIHDALEVRGFQGCAIYDCYGAGPRVTKAFANRPRHQCERDEAFLVMREVHELLWLLTEAAKLCPQSEAALHADVATAIAELDAVASAPVSTVAAADVSRHSIVARELLLRVGHAVRRHGRRSGLLVVAA